MDADDISYPDRLQKQYDYMIAHPECGMLSTWARVISPERNLYDWSDIEAISTTTI